jgi:hypothetical protein
VAARAELESLFTAAAGSLALAALLELLILRSFTRTAIHIPALEAMAGPYRVITTLGRFDYYIAAVLVVACLPLAAISLGSRCGRPGVIAGSGVGLFTMTAFMTRTGLMGEVLPPILLTLTIAVMVGALWQVDRRTGTAMGVYAAAFALAATDTASQAAAQSGLGQLDARPLLWLSEVLAVSAAAAVYWALRPAPQRIAMRCGVGAGAVLLVMFIGGASTSKILLLWNQGLTGTLPAVAYAAAGAALAATLAGLLHARRFSMAAGLLLVIVSGIGLHNTYQSGLGVIGLAALMLAVSGERTTTQSLHDP